MSTGETSVRDLIAHGEVLLAYDQAAALLTEHPDAPRLRYLAALALARAGARDRAIDTPNTARDGSSPAQ